MVPSVSHGFAGSRTSPVHARGLGEGHASSDCGGLPFTETAGVYRPRRSERTLLYRLFEEHFERYVREYEERYEPRERSLRKVVPAAVEAYVIGAILRHLARIGRRDPFEGRAPPAA